MTTNLYSLVALTGESLLAIYPILIQMNTLEIETHTWIRLTSYFLLSAFFANYSLLSQLGGLKLVALSIVNIVHIVSSYYGFRYLMPSLAGTLFYIYPFLNLILNMAVLGEHVVWTKFLFLIPIMGSIYILYADQQDTTAKGTPTKGFVPDIRIGIPAILVAALTESLLYVLIKTSPLGEGLWDALLATYGLAAILYSGYYLTYQRDTLLREWTTRHRSVLSVIAVNLLVGSVGYGLRFVSMSHVPPVLFSAISYSGIFFAVLYSVLLSIETMSSKKAVGLSLLAASLVGMLTT